MLHSTTLESFKNYARRRRGFAKSKSFFVSRSGTKLLSQNVWHVFNRLRPLANLPDHPQSPRIHDLRHSFAVTTLLRWYREGADVEVKLPLLSTYLGHVSPTSTYHYLSDHPELMTVAAKRLERNLGDLP